MPLILTHTAFEAALALHEASSEAIEAVLALSRGYLQLKNHRSDLRLVLSFLDTALRLGRKEEALRVARNSLRVLEKMGPDAERYRPCLLLRLIKGLLGGERTVRSESVCMWSEEDVKTALVEMVTGMGTKDDAQLERKMQYLLHKESDLLKATEYAEARGFPSPRFVYTSLASLWMLRSYLLGSVSRLLESSRMVFSLLCPSSDELYVEMIQSTSP